MSPDKNQDYKESDKLAEEMGWSGSNGHYTTELGLEVDTTGTKADHLAFGYCAAKAAGHITKW